MRAPAPGPSIPPRRRARISSAFARRPRPSSARPMPSATRGTRPAAHPARPRTIGSPHPSPRASAPSAIASAPSRRASRSTPPAAPVGHHQSTPSRWTRSSGTSILPRTDPPRTFATRARSWVRCKPRRGRWRVWTATESIPRRRSNRGSPRRWRRRCETRCGRTSSPPRRRRTIRADRSGSSRASRASRRVARRCSTPRCARAESNPRRRWIDRAPPPGIPA